jgi:hypothetical protein
MKFMLLCYDDEQAWEKAGEAALRDARAEAAQLSGRLPRLARCLAASS